MNWSTSPLAGLLGGETSPAPVEPETSPTATTATAALAVANRVILKAVAPVLDLYRPLVCTGRPHNQPQEQKYVLLHPP